MSILFLKCSKMNPQAFIPLGVAATFRAETKESQPKKVEIVKRVTKALKVSKIQKMDSKYKALKCLKK